MRLARANHFLALVTVGDTTSVAESFIETSVDKSSLPVRLLYTCCCDSRDTRRSLLRVDADVLWVPWTVMSKVGEHGEAGEREVCVAWSCETLLAPLLDVPSDET